MGHASNTRKTDPQAQQSTDTPNLQCFFMALDSTILKE